jgi:hypothetical protein
VVFVANSHNGKVLRINSDGSATQINADAGSLSKPVAILARSDAAGGVSLLVGASGRIVFYGNVNGPGFTGLGEVVSTKVASPLGFSADAAGNVFLVSRKGSSGGSSHYGSSSSSKRQLWVLRKGGTKPGGYHEAELVDGDVDADSLEDTRVVRSGFGDLLSGDLLVLAGGHDARVIVYRKEGSGPYELYDDRFIDLAHCDEPEGLAVVGTNVLVSTDGGDILSFDGSGTEVAKFAANLTGGLNKMEVGFQAGVNKLVVAQKGINKVLAIVIGYSGGNPVAGAITRYTSKISGPEDAAIPNGAGAFVAVNPGTTTVSFDAQDTDFRGVSQAGVTDVTCAITATDPRELECSTSSCPGQCYDGFCKRDLALTELGLPYPGVVIPKTVRSLRLLDSEEGEPRFNVCVGNTSALFRTASTLVHADQWLQWSLTDPGGPGEPRCDGDTTRRAVFYRSIIRGSEPEIYEGKGKTTTPFIPLPTGCEPGQSNRGDIDDYSLLLLAARDSRPFCRMAEDVLAGLIGALKMPELANFIEGTPSSGFEKQLLAKAKSAKEWYERYKRYRVPFKQAEAIRQLDELMALVDANPAKFDNAGAGRNVSGELLVRATAARYVVSEVTLELLCECD